MLIDCWSKTTKRPPSGTPYQAITQNFHVLSRSWKSHNLVHHAYFWWKISKITYYASHFCQIMITFRFWLRNHAKNISKLRHHAIKKPQLHHHENRWGASTKNKETCNSMIMISHAYDVKSSVLSYSKYNNLKSVVL